MKKVQEESYVKASMTIEMTCMVPIIIGGITMFIYIWIFLYNSYLLERTIERALIDYEKQWDLSEEEIKFELLERVEQELSNGLLARQSHYVSVNVDILSIQIVGGYTMKVALASIMDDLIGRPSFAKEYTGNIIRENSVTIIRIYKKLQEVF
ncbi:MAG: hypothetical protein R3Y54_00885 [Eubacteriales bacterium]